MRDTHPLRTEHRHLGHWLAVCLVLLLGLSGLTANAYVVIGRFEAAGQPDGSILVIWQTSIESNSQAFNLYRSLSWAGPWDPDHRVNQQLARGDGFTGALYEFRDTAIVPGVRYWYLVEELTSSGPGDRRGPILARIGPVPTIYLPLIARW